MNPFLLFAIGAAIGVLALGTVSRSAIERHPGPSAFRGPAPRLIPTEEFIASRLASSRLAQRVAPSIAANMTEEPWLTVWLPTIETLHGQSKLMGHALHKYMFPHLRSLSPVFAFAIRRGNEVTGSVVVRWTNGRYVIENVQGPGSKPLDAESMRQVHSLIASLNHQARSLA